MVFSSISFISRYHGPNEPGALENACISKFIGFVM